MRAKNAQCKFGSLFQNVVYSLQIDPKQEYLLVSLVENDIFRADVAVSHSFSVHVLKRVNQLIRDQQDLA